MHCNYRKNLIVTQLIRWYLGYWFCQWDLSHWTFIATISDIKAIDFFGGILVIQCSILQSVISRSFILSMGSWSFDVCCCNQWYLGCSLCRWYLGHSFWSVFDKPLNIINMVWNKALWPITSIKNLFATLNPNPKP